MKDQTNHLYEVDITWNEGRVGTMRSPVLEEKIKVATPPEFDDGVEGIWSPEHLFVASVSSCFMTTFTAIAAYSKLEFENLEIKATGKLEKKDGKFMMTEIILEPEVMITDEKIEDKARRIMEKAETACLISQSIKSEVVMKPRIIIGSLN